MSPTIRSGNPPARGSIIVWMRRALRVHDNTPLWQAIQDAEEVIPLLLLRTNGSGRDHSPRREFIRSAIAECDRELRRLGSRLVVYAGDPDLALPRLLRLHGARGVYAAELTDPRSRLRDQKIAKAIERAGGSFSLFPDRLLRREGEILTAEGRPYRVFTPFKRTWLAGSGEILPPLPRITFIRTPAAPKEETPLDRFAGFGDLPPGKGGEREARRRLKRFLGGPVARYDETRDLPGVDGTSGLSPYLAHGAISVREVYASLRVAAAREPRSKRGGTTAFLNELIWREFYYHVLHHFPSVVTEAFRPEFRRIRWRNDPGLFDAWKEGRTGYPIVDAAMRQLAATGWMHNRARMVVASFLTKDLQIDWRWGEEHFLRHLIDGDIASNNGGWQWCAGTGTDASPWFRIFNPTLQGRKFDPTGSYVRRWIPELRQVPSRSIHAPWDAGGAEGYPGPIIRHEESRVLTMALYREGSG